MKRSTAVRHLTEMAYVASEMLRLRASDPGWPLEELWVSGALLAAGEDLEAALRWTSWWTSQLTSSVARRQPHRAMGM